MLNERRIFLGIHLCILQYTVRFHCTLARSAVDHQRDIIRGETYIRFLLMLDARNSTVVSASSRVSRWTVSYIKTLSSASARTSQGTLCHLWKPVIARDYKCTSVFMRSVLFLSDFNRHQKFLEKLLKNAIRTFMKMYLIKSRSVPCGRSDGQTWRS
jgi:hypothetical protein